MRKALAGLLLAVTALATTGSGASPAACASPCDIQANGLAYVTPATVMASGSTVVFSTTEETSHATTDATNSANSCFYAPVGYGEPPTSVRFDVVGSSLVATTSPGTPYEASAVCASAVPVASGGFVQPFHCVVHAWMRGALVVEPAV